MEGKCIFLVISHDPHSLLMCHASSCRFCLRNVDRFVIEHVGSTSNVKDNSIPISLLAVFDGHGGSAASQFCSDWISSYIRKKNEHYPDNIALAVKSAFTKVSLSSAMRRLPMNITVHLIA